MELEAVRVREAPSISQMRQLLDKERDFRSNIKAQMESKVRQLEQSINDAN